MDQETRCLRCGMWLEKIGKVDPLASVQRPRMDFRPGQIARRRGEWIVRLAAKFSLGGFRLTQLLSCPLPRNVLPRNSWKAGLLSVLPGAGQLYNHQPKKALIFALLLVSWGAFALVTLWQPWSNWVLLAFAALMLTAFHDGVMTARAINGEPVNWWAHKVAFFLAWVTYAYLLALVLSILLSEFFFVQMHRIYGDVLEPVVHSGETVLMNRMAYWFSDPKAGQLVMYKPVDMHVNVTGGHFYVRAENWIPQPTAVGRILAGPGQVVKGQGGQITVDGQPVAPNFLPGDQKFPDTFELTAGPSEYIILVNQHDQFLRPPGAAGKADDFWDAIGKSITGALSWELINWEEVCRVQRNQMTGRIGMVLQPPPNRRIVR